MPETPDEELVRRFLADARHDEPMPADVAARLDGVLRDLAVEGRGPTTVPHRIHSVRRGRWAAGLVAAAAAVTAIALAPRLSTSTSSDSGAGSASDRSVSGSEAGGKAASQPPEVAVLSRASLATDVRAARRRLTSAPSALVADGAALASACAPPGPGTAMPARLDDQEAVLVLRPPASGRQVADVLQCGTARVLASVTLRVR